MSENRMELFIETLTGTAFELSCSPLETIVSIKAKIQYSEGIPVSQQHLIWKSQELNDDLCLQDYSITDGATLKLVLGMRGGPINTRQISDSKKLKDIAEYVERSSEAGSSGGRPLTVLVFHDGDKVHMYTLMERGDCTVSRLSGTISETSSIASIKNVEELDQELVRENEVTRSKISQLQEQLKALNINKSKRFSTSTAQSRKSIQQKSTSGNVNNFHLPPLKRVDAFDSETKQYSSQDAQSKPSLSDFAHNSKDIPNARNNNEIDETCENKSLQSLESSDSHAALNIISNSVSTFILSSPDKSSLGSKSSSSFLPYITSAQRPVSNQKSPFPIAPPKTPRLITINMNRSNSQDSIIKYDYSVAKKAHKRIPITSNQAISSQKFLDLDSWLQNRPKTTPEKSVSRNSLEEKQIQNKVVFNERSKRKLKNSKTNSLSMGVASSGKSNLLMQVFEGPSDISCDFKSSLNSKSHVRNPSIMEKPGIGSLVASSLKVFNEYSPDTSQKKEDFNRISNIKTVSSKRSEESQRPQSGKKLPFIKTKKKSHKRCTVCSKKTGLATSYTCRCGKNFCASHRYAETHHCTYDYKTEGRRMLQLNNPVVTASKLPKI